MRWTIAILACVAQAQTLELPRTVRQGGVLRIRASAAAVTARMGERSIRLFPDASGSFGLMPVSAIEKPGEYKIELLDQAGASIASASVQVQDARYPRQNVTVAAGVAELKASPEETEMVNAFRATVSETRHWTEPLELPVRGCMTSPFGVQRYLNGKASGNYHAGLDQRSPSGTPIHAAAAGVVKIARDWTLHGRTIGIDHGQGVASIYLHMSKLAATEGATVKKGDVIGYVGSTGRSNAPHLHWSLYVNGLPVNPVEWTPVARCAPAGKKKAR
jgi:murein DD-endopeptidase MepM/ murein hydrolase activator NlpD